MRKKFIVNMSEKIISDLKKEKQGLFKNSKRLGSQIFWTWRVLNQIYNYISKSCLINSVHSNRFSMYNPNKQFETERIKLS